MKLVFPFEKDVMYDWWMAVVAANDGGVQDYPKVLVYQRGHETNIAINKKEALTTERERRSFYKK